MPSDDMRNAWSCPLPNEIFEVGSQGHAEDVAGLGVAIALGQLLSEPHTPARHASQILDPLPLCLSPHLTLCAALLAGLAPCPIQ